MTTLTPTFTARFWRRAKPTDAGCWEWQGATATKLHYGAVKLAGRVEYAHRIAWTLTHGAVPAGLCVLHTCDNPRCCNPGHLFLGTRATNSDDKVAKRRHLWGSEIPCARLTESLAAEIPTAYATGEFSIADLAREYGVVPRGCAAHGRGGGEGGSATGRGSEGSGVSNDGHHAACYTMLRERDSATRALCVVLHVQHSVTRKHDNAAHTATLAGMVAT